jgi:hyperosmotically inducible periplasmic protein
VADSVSRDLAFQITQGVKGITLVDDRLDVDANHAPPAQSAQRAFGNLVDDATISCRVKSKVLWSRHGVGIRAHVDTARGVVNLSGTAHTDEARDFAGKLAANTSGVRAVENQLVVKPVKAGVELSGVPDIADVWITAKVKSTFKLSNDLDGTAIAVSTNAGTVKLTGRLDCIAERAVAIELAGNVRGAKTVDSSSLTL